MMNQAIGMLNGLRVVEFAEGIAGPLAGLRLSELGAHVIKLEPPGGDWLRNAEPFVHQENSSAAFYDLNRGKCSVELGPNGAAAAPLIRSLIKQADVFITDRRADELGSFGIDVSDGAITADNAKLIAVLISAWGRKGPYANRKGSELTAQAMSGYTRYLGSFDKPALRLGADVALAGTGIFAVQAVLAALYARKRTDRGQRIDLSLLNSLLAMKSVHLAAQSDPDKYDGPRVGGANHAPLRGWKTADDPIFFKFGGAIGSEGRQGWVEFVKEIGLDHLLDDPRCDKAGRETTGHGLYAPALRTTYERAFARYGAKELCSIIARHGGDAAVYISADEMLAHPQMQAMGFIRPASAADATAKNIRAFPGRFSRLQTRTSVTAPALGQHTAAVASELGFDGQALIELRRTGALQELPERAAVRNGVEQ